MGKEKEYYRMIYTEYQKNDLVFFLSVAADWP